MLACLAYLTKLDLKPALSVPEPFIFRVCYPEHVALKGSFLNVHTHACASQGPRTHESVLKLSFTLVLMKFISTHDRFRAHRDTNAEGQIGSLFLFGKQGPANALTIDDGCKSADFRQ